MPTYEYKCKACGNEFEYQQRISDPPKSVCEQCGGTLEKLISRSSFHLKGSGWYKDLYSSPKPANSSSEGSSKESSAKESSGSAKESSGGGSSDSGSASTSSTPSTSSSTAAAGK